MLCECAWGSSCCFLTVHPSLIHFFCSFGQTISTKIWNDPTVIKLQSIAVNTVNCIYLTVPNCLLLNSVEMLLRGGRTKTHGDGRSSWCYSTCRRQWGSADWGTTGDWIGPRIMDRVCIFIYIYILNVLNARVLSISTQIMARLRPFPNHDCFFGQSNLFLIVL